MINPLLLHNAVVANILKANHMIEKVNLSYNRIGRHGAAALGEALAGMPRFLMHVTPNRTTVRCGLNEGSR